MKKHAFVLLFSAISVAAIILPAYAGKEKDLFHMVIEKIEQKYQELRSHSPFIKARGKNVAQSIRFIQPEDGVIKDYSKLRQIALVRHGEPDIKKNGQFTQNEAHEFLKCYDSVCIIVPEKPFFNINDKEEVKVFSSPINRALTTAHYLCGNDKEITTSRDFREFETKIDKDQSEKKRSIKFWTTTARLKWMAGIGKNGGIETFKDAKKRAKRAAATLDQASTENPKVLLTAHGFLNRYIKKNLEKQGWKIVEDTGSDYFGTTILVKVDK